LPIGFPGRDFIILTTFVVIAVTVLVQGASLGPLVEWLKPASPELHGAAHLNEHQARATVYEAALALISTEIDAQGREIHPRLTEEYRRRVFVYRRNHEDREAIAEVRRAHFDMALAATRAARGELLRLHRAGEIHDTTLHAVEAELDLEEARLRRLSGDLGSGR
jgi:CPA1 family monovalent cation:H+ antiporter